MIASDNIRMATTETTSVTTDENELFDLVTKEIKKTFDPLIDQLTERRDTLLKEVEDKKEKNITRETTRKAALEEVIETQQHLEGLSLKVNEEQRVPQPEQGALQRADRGAVCSDQTPPALLLLSHPVPATDSDL